jgi:hypothetical protein
VDAQADDHQAVQRAAHESHADGDGEAEDERRDRRFDRGRAQRHRHRHTGERVDRADREIDAARDDHDRRADRHDGEEARVGPDLDQRVRVEEVVDREAREAVDVAAGERGEDRAEQDDDGDESRLLGREQFPKHSQGG